MDPKTARRLEALQAEVARWDRWQVHDEAPAFSPILEPGLQPPSLQLDARAADPVGDLADWPASALARAIARRDLSPMEVTRAFLDRIEARNPDLNAFVAVMAEEALEQAHQAPPGPLQGVPVALKDMYHVQGWPTRAGSRLLAGAPPAAADAALVARLRAAGAILLGKTATHEFAYGCTTDSPFCGPTRNPADPGRSPGGSSGGSAAAVAAGMAPLALGTDTAGSVRVPAACCGVAGLKPTYGALSTEGILPLCWSLDHPGTLTRTVGDAALLLAVLGGRAVPAGRPESLQGLRVGVPVAWTDTPMDPEVRLAFNRSLQALEAQGALVVEVTLPPLDLCHFVSRVLTLAEAGAYHAAYLNRLDEYGPDVRSRVDLGQHVAARDYLLAQRLRAQVCRQVTGTMAQVHLLATPAQPVPAPLIGQRTVTYPGGQSEPVADALLRFAAPFNVTGQPAVSIPADRTAAGLPVGLQLAGAPHAEALLLQVATVLTA